MERRPARSTTTITTIVTLVLSAVAVVAVPSSAEADGHERYRDEVFDDVVVTKDLHYTTSIDYKGDPVDLHLDLYEPAGDVAPVRPLMLYLHGGGFTDGDKAGGREVELSSAYARRGFVVASVNYRVDPTTGGGLEDISDPEFLQAILDAFADSQTAIAWLRANAAPYRIDTNAVFASGYSAGAVLSLLLAYGPDANNPDSATSPSRVSGAISISGTALPGLVQPGEPIAYMIHGDIDPRVPYASAVEVCNAVNAVGSYCQFVTMVGTGHNPTAYHGQLLEESSVLMFERVLVPLGYTTEISPAGPPVPPGTEETPTTSTDAPAGSPGGSAGGRSGAGRVTAPRFTG